jgi:hypothetical protein
MLSKPIAPYFRQAIQLKLTDSIGLTAIARVFLYAKKVDDNEVICYTLCF